MPRQQNGLIGQRQDPFSNAAEQLPSVSTRILIIPTASFENGIPNKGHIVPLVVEDGRVRRMSGCVDYPQGTSRITLQLENIPVPEVHCAMHGHIAMAIAR